jgi:hydroxyethylthiazole kinase-like uncharacterized protein yjeF
MTENYESSQTNCNFHASTQIACAFAEVFPDVSRFSRVLAVAGPGNNGGDALVAARHLRHFGYAQVEVLYPKPTLTPPLFPGLVAQLKDLEVPFIPDLPVDFETKYDVVVDGVFGFSFNPSNGVRPPFDSILRSLRKTKLPVVSIDIPSGKAPSFEHAAWESDVILNRLGR